MKLTYNLTGLALYALLAAAAPLMNGRHNHASGDDLDLGGRDIHGSLVAVRGDEGPNATPDNTHVTRNRHVTRGELLQDDEASPDNVHATRDRHRTKRQPLDIAVRDSHISSVKSTEDIILDNVHATDENHQTRDRHTSRENISEDGDVSPDNTHVTKAEQGHHGLIYF